MLTHLAVRLVLASRVRPSMRPASRHRAQQPLLAGCQTVYDMYATQLVLATWTGCPRLHLKVSMQLVNQPERREAQRGYRLYQQVVVVSPFRPNVMVQPKASDGACIGCKLHNMNPVCLQDVRRSTHSSTATLADTAAAFHTMETTVTVQSTAPREWQSCTAC